MPLENEIKLRISDAASVRRHLRRAGYRVHSHRVFESNDIFDTAEGRLRAKGELLRIRRKGGESLLTHKGLAQPGPHKSREEIETDIGDAGALEEIFSKLDLRKVFRYEKYRTEFSRRGSPGVITLDETPIGNFLELEGPAEWVDATARELGHEPSEYITLSYGGLYFQYCREHGIEPSNMVFGSRDRSRRRSQAKH